MKKIILTTLVLLTLNGCVNTDSAKISAISDCEGRSIKVESRELTLCKAQAPLYPKKAYLEKITGICFTRFDVTERGEVTNIRSSCNPAGYFEKAAIKSKEKFVYLPKVVGGKPVATYDVVRKDEFY